MNITQTIAAELNATAAQVEAAVALLDEGATVPFIARYRKEATGALDDSQLRTLAERLQYLRELLERKATVLKSIEEQGTHIALAVGRTSDSRIRPTQMMLPNCFYFVRLFFRIGIRRPVGLLGFQPNLPVVSLFLCIPL